MANTPRKAQDPTQAALSAIENALQLGSEEAESAPANEIPRRPAPPPESRFAEASTAARSDDDPFAMNRGLPRRSDRMSRAANDDRQSVGQILATLNARPSRAPYVIAGIAAIWWISMALFLGYTRASEDIAAAGTLLEIVDLPYFWSYTATLVLPPIAFLLFAAFIRRTQEMRFISRAMTEVTLRLAEPEGVSADAIVSVGQAIRREVAALGDGIERAVARAAELEVLVHNEVAGLERAYEDNEKRVLGLVADLQRERDAIISHGSRLREAFAGSHESFMLDIEGVSERINSVIDEATARVTHNIVTQAGTASAQISATGDVLIDSLSSKSNEITERLTQVGGEISKTLGERGTTVANSLYELTGKTAESLHDMTAKATGSLEQVSAQVTDSMRDATVNLANSVAERGDAIRDDLVASLQAAEESLVRRGNEIAGRISTDSAELSRSIGDALYSLDNAVRVHGGGLADQITQATNSLSDQTKTSLDFLDERIASRMEQTTDSLDSRISRIEQTLDARSQHLSEMLAERTLEIARSFSDGSQQATEAVDSTLAGMGEYFGNKAQEIAATITERTEAADAILGKRTGEIAANLDLHVQRFEEQVVDRLDVISTSIETKGLAVADALAGKVDEVTARIRTETDDVERKLVQLSEEVSKNLVERMNETTEKFVAQTAQVTASNETLHQNVVGVLARLAEANELTKELLESVTNSLDPMETNFAQRLSEFQRTLTSTIESTRESVDWVEGQMRELRGISGGVLRDLSVLTQRFETQGRFISNVAESLAETHGRIDQSLSERRETIDHIVQMLIDRTSEIEDRFGVRSTEIGERLAGFNRLMQESLALAEERARDVARFIADSTNQASQTISKQHELIRSAYSEERGRTASALKSIYQEAMEEMKQIFTELQDRFTESSVEVRQVAQEVQTSLEQTRQELKRGVLELPHETQESTAAMRRVVADQIKALAELNDIVARHARATELMEPRRITYREEPAAISAGGGPRYGPQRRGEEEPVAELPRAPRHAAPRFEQAEEQRRAPVQRQAAEPRRAGREDGGERRGGWLTGLLSQAASPDEGTEEEHSPLQAIDSLDTLSADIARVVDHNAVSDLWDRYRRGERNVLTRRLYTRQGQKTFEEIRRKYRKDPEFRETVDRYIDEFERLLDQVSRDDRGQVLSKSYLTSDTGKVYTLLAHASGKLD